MFKFNGEPGDTAVTALMFSLFFAVVCSFFIIFCKERAKELQRETQKQNSLQQIVNSKLKLKEAVEKGQIAIGNKYEQNKINISRLEYQTKVLQGQKMEKEEMKGSINRAVYNTYDHRGGLIGMISEEEEKSEMTEKEDNSLKYGAVSNIGRRKEKQPKEGTVEKFGLFDNLQPEDGRSDASARTMMVKFRV